jgi:hypothetical protein
MITGCILAYDIGTSNTVARRDNKKLFFGKDHNNKSDKEKIYSLDFESAQSTESG